jgi:hypothetical protein
MHVRVAFRARDREVRDVEAADVVRVRLGRAACGECPCPAEDAIRADEEVVLGCGQRAVREQPARVYILCRYGRMKQEYVR